MAAICLVSLRYLEEDNQYRRDISDTYTHGLEHLNKINLIQHDQEISSSRHLYQISLDKRDDLINFLHEKSIYCGVHYLNNQDCGRIWKTTGHWDDDGCDNSNYGIIEFD